MYVSQKEGKTDQVKHKETNRIYLTYRNQRNYMSAVKLTNYNILFFVFSCMMLCSWIKSAPSLLANKSGAGDKHT